MKEAMVELKPLKRINCEYRTLLEKYEGSLDYFCIEDYKRLIGEVKLFWYRNRNFVSYFMGNIEPEDEVSFLAGAVRLDIVNYGHYEYIASGKTRLIDDPFLKMEGIYNGVDSELNFDYMNKYLKDCICDLLEILRHYSDDYYIIPINLLCDEDGKEYRKGLIETSNKLILALFEKEYTDIKRFELDNRNYEQIESILKPFAKSVLVFQSLEDNRLSLREKSEKYIKDNETILPFINTVSESQLFVIMVSQFLMQALAITLTMKTYHLIPFIRNDVVFQYFNMIYNSNVFMDFSEKEYAYPYITYWIQKAFEFSDKDYYDVKRDIGNGKLVTKVMKAFDKKILSPKETVECIRANISGVSGSNGSAVSSALP